MTTRRQLAGLSLVTVLALCWLSPTSRADWQPDQDQRLQVKAHAVLDKFRERRPETKTYFDAAYGYAVLPSITRAGFGFGGAYGKGIVIEQDNVVGRTGYWQFTSGIQAGAKNFSMIVFFKDEQALDYFKRRDVQFTGQAGIDVATVGAAATPAYNDGVAIFTLTRLGLMGEFTVSGARFTYRAYD